MKSKKQVVIVSTKKRIPYDDRYYVIVPDMAAGRRNMYTVYSVPSSPGWSGSRRIRVIGRELPLGYAKRLCAKHASAVQTG